MQVKIPEQDQLTSQLLNNVGIAISNDGLETLPTAIAILRRAYRLNPLDTGRALNLASCLVRAGEDDEAEHLLTIALKHDEKLWLGWQIMGFIRTMAGDLGTAIDCFKRAYDMHPEDGQRIFDLASAYMRAGDFARGLPLYEHRHSILPKTSPPPPAPKWDGSKTGHLAVWGDQGHGDRIMFARFLPWAKERADKITLLTDPASIPLFAGYSAIAELGIGWNLDDTRFDHQIALGSLPMVYGMTADNIPPDPGLIVPARTAGALGAPGLKIGIHWFGNPAFPGNCMRTVPFENMLPLAADPRNTVFSLQVGPRSADIAKARAQRIVHDMAGQVEGEWSHTAAVIANLDLVVSNCSAVCHLAGAMGKPTFVMLPRFSDWRWLWGRDETPWYPHMRLFKQAKAGQWSDVVARIVKAVDQMHDRRALVAMLNRAHANVVDEYEPDVASALRKILRPGDTFIDVGANVGRHTLLAASLVGEAGRVLAFEPGGNVLPQLCLACAGKAQIEIVAKPLWCRSEDVAFYLCADGSGGNALYDPGRIPINEKTRANPHKVTLPGTTLDAECEQRELSPRLIKIDTEGGEQRVLEGAIALMFEKKPPFIIAEFHEFGLHELGGSLPDLRAMMTQFGYQTFQLFADGSRPFQVPDDKPVKQRKDCVTNLLFSTTNEINAIWTETPSEGLRPVHLFPLRMPENGAAEKQTAESAA